MKKDQAAKWHGKHMALHPKPVEYLGDRGAPRRLRPKISIEGDWFIQKVDLKVEKVQLYHAATRHQIDLGFDHIREYQSGISNYGTLLLKSQIIFIDDKVELEPMLTR